MIYNKKEGSLFGGFKINRKIVSFFICFLVACFFWLLSSLSKEYSSRVSIPVKYLNLPSGKVLSGKLPLYLTGVIKAKGFNLVVYKIRKFRDTLSIDLTSSTDISRNGESYILPGTLIDKFSAQLPADIKLFKIQPDTVYFNFSSVTSKKVPVNLQVDIDFEDQYRLKDKIQVIPESVLVSGGSTLIDRIQFVETEKIKLTNVNSNVTRSVAIDLKNELKQLDVSETKVDIRINVDKYTERVIQIPIEIVNLPKGVTLKTFPDKVSVKFNIALTEFEKINENMFKATVNAADVLNMNTSKLRVEITKKPTEAKNISFNPDKVEFIIKK